MQLINPSTQQVVSLVQFKSLYPNTSFPRDPANIPFEDYGCALVQDTDRPEATELQRVVEGAPELVDGVWRQTWEVVDRYETVGAAAEAMCHRVDALRDEKLRSGYTFTHTDNADYTLQTRGEEDRVNWLGVLSAAQAYVMAGAGDVQTMSIRTQENDTLALSCNDLQTLMLNTLNWQSLIYGAAWQHKDTLRGYTLMSEVAAHDITADWPA